MEEVNKELGLSASASSSLVSKGKSSASSTALTTTTSKDLIEFKSPLGVPLRKKKPRIVLEEDQYASNLEKIIERDYFPDLEKLNAQNAYLNAVENNDIHMLRELYSKYTFGKRTPKSRRSDTLNTPSTFETPTDLPKATPIPLGATPAESESSPTHLPMEEPGGEDDNDDASSTTSRKSNRGTGPSSLNLNDYLNTYTSEDNQSFSDFMDEAEKKHRIKYSWLYDTEEKNAEQRQLALMVPSMETQALEYNRPLDVETWGYKARNTVMYVPDGVAFTPAEEIEMAKKRAQVIFPNTRFKKTPFKEPSGPTPDTMKQTPGTSSSIASGIGKPSAAGFLRNVEGKIGVDGKEVDGITPKVNGFSYVRTPSPTPGIVEESPFMTWGEIEGTPFRLDGGDTPVPAACSKPFRISDQSKREKLALELAEKVSQRYRDKKLKAIQVARSHLATPSPATLKSGLDRLSSMSPAAQKFAKSHFGSKICSSDKSLMNSYTPKRTPGGGGGSSTRSDKTPVLTTPTPSSTSNKTPRGSSSTSTRSHITTDNLLNLPTFGTGTGKGKSGSSEKDSRKRAFEFF